MSASIKLTPTPELESAFREVVLSVARLLRAYGAAGESSHDRTLVIKNQDKIPSQAMSDIEAALEEMGGVYPNSLNTEKKWACNLEGIPAEKLQDISAGLNSRTKEKHAEALVFLAGQFDESCDIDKDPVKFLDTFRKILERVQSVPGPEKMKLQRDINTAAARLRSRQV